jgi:hypothetical protein
VSYRLYFGALQTLTALITLGLVVLGWGWPRLTLLSAALALWMVGYASLHLLAAHHFRDLLSDLMTDVLERRAQPRKEAAAAPARPQQPE